MEAPAEEQGTVRWGGTQDAAQGRRGCGRWEGKEKWEVKHIRGGRQMAGMIHWNVNHEGNARMSSIRRIYRTGN